MKLSKNINTQFVEVISMIKQARYTAIRSVNAEQIKLYWQVGEYISKKLESAQWGEGVVEGLADYIQTTNPEFKGFTRRGLYRMRQFYETYRHNQIVSPLVTQLSWTNHLMILSKTKGIEEKEFYIRLSIKESYSKRELERQIDSGYYERAMLSRKKAFPLIAHQHPQAVDAFKDSYVLDFLSLPKTYNEKDLQQSIVANLKDFILEFGRDFSFIGQEYRIQVGNHDYFLDLLFFHRQLRCLVMVE